MHSIAVTPWCPLVTVHTAVGAQLIPSQVFPLEPQAIVHSPPPPHCVSAHAVPEQWKVGVSRHLSPVKPSVQTSHRLISNLHDSLHARSSPPLSPTPRPIPSQVSDGTSSPSQASPAPFRMPSPQYSHVD